MLPNTALKINRVSDIFLKKYIKAFWRLPINFLDDQIIKK